jgi:hypothetical protein
MGYDLSVLGGGALTTRDSVRSSRAIGRAQAAGQIRQAHIDSEADVASAKLDAVTNATGQAMRDVARVGQAELAFAQATPAASGRLANIAEQHAWLVSELVCDLHTQVRRK